MASASPVTPMIPHMVTQATWGTSAAALRVGVTRSPGRTRSSRCPGPGTRLGTRPGPGRSRRRRPARPPRRRPAASRASTMTRTSGSVPLGRSRTRPSCPNSASAFTTASQTSAQSARRSGRAMGTLTNRWGTRSTSPSERSDSERPVRSNRSARASPVSMPSPVVDNERKMMCPDCSPPRLSPWASNAASTWRSPTSVSRTAMPRCAIARRKPRLVMTVTTTVSAGQPAARRRGRARRGPGGRRRRPRHRCCPPR